MVLSAERLSILSIDSGIKIRRIIPSGESFATLQGTEPDWEATAESGIVVQGQEFRMKNEGRI